MATTIKNPAQRPLTSVLFAALISLACSAPVLAASKYAVVDMQKVILSVAEGKTARANLEKEIKNKEKELKKQKQELDKLNKAWKEQAPLLSESARLKKQQEFQQKFISLRNKEMSFQSEIKKKELRATQSIAVKVTKLVDKIAKAKGYDMVFESSSSGLIYLKNPVDITADVVKAYGKSGKKTAKK